MLAAAGDREGMFDCLERAPITMLSYFNFEPIFAPYQDDTRFARLLERAGKVTPGGVAPSRTAL